MPLTFPPSLSAVRAASLALGLALAGAVLPGAALAGPPPGAQPLSAILAALEARGDVAWFEEVEWDDDGYWEVEYRRPDGSLVKLRLDPMTGAPRR